MHIHTSEHTCTYTRTHLTALTYNGIADKYTALTRQGTYMSAYTNVPPLKYTAMQHTLHTQLTKNMKYTARTPPISKDHMEIAVK